MQNTGFAHHGSSCKERSLNGYVLVHRVFFHQIGASATLACFLARFPSFFACLATGSFQQLACMEEACRSEIVRGMDNNVDMLYYKW